MKQRLIEALIVIGMLVAIVGTVVYITRGAAPVSTSLTDNNAIHVEQLFTHEGCTMYRFHDAGYPRYYVRCGAAAGTFWGETHSTGKSSYQVPMEVPTQ